MTVSSVMTHNPVTIREDENVVDAQALMKEQKIHRLPVLNHQNKLVGIVSEKDLLYASPSPASTLSVYELSGLLAKLQVAKVMTKKVLTVAQDTLVEEAASMLVDNNIGGLPVMKDDLLVGIVTESDLFRLLIDLFGTRRRGVRATLRVPERPGEIADMAKSLTDAGADIVSLGTFPGNDLSNAVLTLKVSEITKDKLLTILEPLVVEVMDVRES